MQYCSGQLCLQGRSVYTSRSALHKSEWLYTSHVPVAVLQRAVLLALHTLRPTPYALHPTPYTLHPTPYALHPTPSTLHPTPSTLRPIPQAADAAGGGLDGALPLDADPQLGLPTLNPQPPSLNPQPSTLNPQPSTFNPQPSRCTSSSRPTA